MIALDSSPDLTIPLNCKTEFILDTFEKSDGIGSWNGFLFDLTLLDADSKSPEGISRRAFLN